MVSRFSCYQCEYDLCSSCNGKCLEAVTTRSYLGITRYGAISSINPKYLHGYRMLTKKYYAQPKPLVDMICDRQLAFFVFLNMIYYVYKAKNVY